MLSPLCLTRNFSEFFEWFFTHHLQLKDTADNKSLASIYWWCIVITSHNFTTKAQEFRLYYFSPPQKWCDIHTVSLRHIWIHFYLVEQEKGSQGRGRWSCYVSQSYRGADSWKFKKALFGNVPIFHHSRLYD